MRFSCVIALALLCLLLLPMGAGAQEIAPTASPAKMQPQGESWVLIPDLGPNATQADYGAEVYRLVCKACHGDRGQGLTPDWIVQWAPDDQNCWQSKCHSANHPPDGFVLPRDIPPAIGATVASRFTDGLQLQRYIAATMPWHAPGTLESEEYWQVTAYLLAQSGVEIGNATLNEENAASYTMTASGPVQGTTVAAATQRPPGAAATRQAQIAADRSAAEAADESWPWGWIALLLGSMAGIIWVIYIAVRQA